MTRADVQLIFDWIADPDISRWWGERPERIEEIEGKYIPRLDGSEPITCIIAELDGVPFAFLQWYRLRDEPEHPAVGLVPEGYAALDLFVGPADGRGRGLGQQMIRVFMTEVIATHADVAGFAIDPAEANLRAIGAYRAAAFRVVGTGTDGETGGPCLVMAVTRAELARGGQANASAEAAHTGKNQE
jgi:RimJ/RimL family protein N-acetyltransferase